MYQLNAKALNSTQPDLIPIVQLGQVIASLSLSFPTCEVVMIMPVTQGDTDILGSFETQDSGSCKCSVLLGVAECSRWRGEASLKSGSISM